MILVFDSTSAESDDFLDPDRILTIQPSDKIQILPSFTSVSVRSLHEELFEQLFNLLLNKGIFFNSKERRLESPFNYQCPTCLEGRLNFKIQENGENQTVLLEYLEEILKYSPRVSHPYYLAKCGAGYVYNHLVQTFTRSLCLEFFHLRK